MQSKTHDPWRSRSAYAKHLLIAAVCLQVAHTGVILVLPHPLIASNLIQLCFPLLAVVVSFHQGSHNLNATGRRCWLAVGCAFLIWAGAQLLFIYFLSRPVPPGWSVRPDDALWVLFGLPLILAVTTTSGEADRVAWLDRMQVTLFFAVLYLLVFLPSSKLAVTKAYLIQNFALVLCCFLRLPASSLARERRFFLNLSVFLLAYSILESVGELLYKRGWQVGSLVDLVWSLPICLFIVLVLKDALRQENGNNHASRLVEAAGSTQGLSVAALTFLSIVVAGLLCIHNPVLGGIMLALAFLLFALRTNARERLWQVAHQRLEDTVLQDPLTGLGNRLQLSRCLSEGLSTRVDRALVLLFIDLDRFKQINDSLGHALGDHLLIEVGRRLSAASPPGAIVCRLGGDEFVVLTSTEGSIEAQDIANHLLVTLHRPMHVGTHQLRCSASIGLVMADSADTAENLLRTADHAMYRAKQLGRDRVQVFDAELRAQMSYRWQLESELRKALEAHEIQVAFQAIYSIPAAAICGFEALARWQHPTLGNIPPAQFIPLAEESGMIFALGEQILVAACQQVAQWNRRWGTALSVSINVSPRQLADAGLLAVVLSALEQSGLTAGLLRLEMTETALLTNEVVVKRTLEEARAHGIQISLDDFGTGYSSLSFLLSLPVDEVKVDRSFVSHMHQDPDRGEVVRTVIHLGHSLGKRVVAEGVESEQDLQGLAAMGCECVQGYLISQPLLPDEMQAKFPSLAAWNAHLSPPGSTALHGNGSFLPRQRPPQGMDAVPTP